MRSADAQDRFDDISDIKLHGGNYDYLIQNTGVIT